jgi:hypothetical protein
LALSTTGASALSEYKSLFINTILVYPEEFDNPRPAVHHLSFRHEQPDHNPFRTGPLKMIRYHIPVLVLAAALCACSKSVDTPELPIRYSAIGLEDMNTAENLSALCSREHDALREHLRVLEAFDGTATVGNYFESLNSLSVSLSNVSSAAQSLGGVHPDEAVRSAGDECAQSLARIATDIGLSRPLYEAVSSIDLADADDVTRYAVSKSLLSFRLSGVDKDEATRNRIRQLNDDIVAIGQDFDRNIREDVRYLETFTVRPIRGINVQNTYTWSKNLGLFGETGRSYQNPFDRDDEYSILPDSRRHDFRTNGTFTLPVGPNPGPMTKLSSISSTCCQVRPSSPTSATLNLPPLFAGTTVMVRFSRFLADTIAFAFCGATWYSPPFPPKVAPGAFWV